MAHVVRGVTGVAIWTVVISQAAWFTLPALTVIACRVGRVGDVANPWRAP